MVIISSNSRSGNSISFRSVEIGINTMPSATFIPLVQEVLKSQGIIDGRIIEDAGFDEYFLAKEVLPKILVDTYGVSRTAAYVKLRKFGFVVDQETVNKEKKQVRLF